MCFTFLPGPELMIQIQSSWFPIIDRNPQRFIVTYHCTVEDFVMKQRSKFIISKELQAELYTTCGKKIKEVPTSSNVIPARAVWPTPAFIRLFYILTTICNFSEGSS